MTKGELFKIKARITEISEAIDLCDGDRDADVLENLTLELENIVKKLNEFLALVKP